jgi:hypothetical protein
MNLVKMKELEIRIAKLEGEIWKIKNPPKFKHGDMVKSDTSNEIIINNPFLHTRVQTLGNTKY